MTHGRLFPEKYFAYILVMDGNPAVGIAGVQFGIQYDNAVQSGVDVLSWHLCASLEFPWSGWPASMGGNLITWDPTNLCQRTEPGGSGTGSWPQQGTSIWPPILRTRLRSFPGRWTVAKVADCSAAESIIEGGGIHPAPSHLGLAGFSDGSGYYGYNPCGVVVMVVPTTWSGIKTLYH